MLDPTRPEDFFSEAKSLVGLRSYTKPKARSPFSDDRITDCREFARLECCDAQSAAELGQLRRFENHQRRIRLASDRFRTCTSEGASLVASGCGIVYRNPSVSVSRTINHFGRTSDAHCGHDYVCIIVSDRRPGSDRCQERHLRQFAKALVFHATRNTHSEAGLKRARILTQPILAVSVPNVAATANASWPRRPIERRRRHLKEGSRRA